MSKEKNNGISTNNDSKFSAPREEGVMPSCVVITYSVSPTLDAALSALQSRGASVHYIIDKDGKQYQYHNDLESKAFYAGESSWKGQEKVNDFGIGIMFINDATSDFIAVQKNQATKLLADIKVRYPYINMDRDLVGLGEVALDRHIAPGSKFFWKDLADAGYGRWVETTPEQRGKILIREGDEGQEVGNVKSRLRDCGYNVTTDQKCDENDTKCFAVFNNRYVPGQQPPNVCSEATDRVLCDLAGCNKYHDEVPLAGGAEDSQAA